jgi:hypothetical protein
VFDGAGGEGSVRSGRALVRGSSAQGERLLDPRSQLGRISPLTYARSQVGSVEPFDPVPQERGADEDRLAERKALLDLMPRPARGSGVDEDHRSRQPRHQAIALGEVPPSHGCAGFKGRNNEVLNRDSLLEAGVMTGVGLVKRGSENGDGAPAFAHGTFVGAFVDTCGEARENYEASVYELRGDFGGERSSFVRSPPRAHYGDARAAEEAHVSGGVQRAPARKRDGGPNRPPLNRTVRQGDGLDVHDL